MTDAPPLPSSSEFDIPPRSAALPLSWAQQRLWFLSQFDPATSTAYHMHVVLRLGGTLHRPALRQALDRLVERHENLRTVFLNSDDGPVQVIAAPSAGFALREEDLRGLPAAAQAAALAQEKTTEARQAFDLATGPLIRGCLLQLDDAASQLIITMHHIISDGWSMGVLMREVAALYQAYCRDLPDPLPALAIQYADYALWQRSWLRGATQRRQTAFWQAQLAGAPPVLAMPTDWPRPAAQSYRAGTVAVRLAPAQAAALRQLAQRHNATLFMVLLAAWALVLARMSGQRDLVIGTTVANRHLPQTGSLIGFFVNTLALRVRLEGDPTIAQLLADVKAMTLDAYSHQDLPFEQVVEALQPQRSLSHSPVFQTLLTLDNTPFEGAIPLPGLTLSYEATPQQSTPFDLALVLANAGEGMAGELTYATDLFHAESAARLAGHFVTVLASMAADTQQTASRVQLMTPAQRRQLRMDFNATAAPYPHDQSIHQLFERQAAAQPEAIAAICAAQQMCYSELNQRANQVAHQLLAMGIRPGDRIAIGVERSLDMLAGILGILKAGAAYIPLDPAHPQERLAYMLADSAPAALLTQSPLAAGFAGAGVPLVLLDRDGAAWPDTNPSLQLDSKQLAYIIYTSGSTGQPKGVMVEHRAVLNLLHAMAAAPGIGRTDTLLALTTLSFDIAGLELYLPLVNGAKVVVASRDMATDAALLAQTIEQHAVTLLQATPATWRLLLAGGWQGAGNLTALCGGEALPAELAAQLLPRVAALWNLYGPTETTIWSTRHQVGANAGLATVPIGLPINNTRIYLLDDNMQPVPIGACGEIHIGGDGVARGYLHRESLTSERFIGDPYGDSPSARLYKTGDLGRWLPDGNIEYLGRSDFQVKLRGFRVEPGEIEAQLMECAGVREAQVVAYEAAPGDMRLAAYLVAHGGVELSFAELRARLAATLPEHMVPTSYVVMEAFPLTPNGKRDRKALPVPGQAASASRGYEAPHGPAEIALAAAWQDLLGVEKVGRHDHFFELGGHSLLALTLANRLQAQGLALTVRNIFAAPTLAEMAALAGVPDTSGYAVPDNLIPAGFGETAGAVEEFTL